MKGSNSLKHAAQQERAISDKLASALQRAIIELEYAQERLGQDRVSTRGPTIADAKTAIASFQKKRAAMTRWA